jgi:hypothetical protein
MDASPERDRHYRRNFAWSFLISGLTAPHSPVLPQPGFWSFFNHERSSAAAARATRARARTVWREEDTEVNR